ncbi:LuxR C-terminal-related transcriptional regulator [Phormidesmis sp. 146-35]
MNQQKLIDRFNRLSSRQRQVLIKVLAGESNRAIAQSLHIVEATVRKHIEKICEVFELANQSGERFSKRPDLIALFARYKPELVMQVSDTATSSEEEPHTQSEVRSNNLLQFPSLINSSESVTKSVKEGKFETIYDRDVFILIDQSGSMVRKDADTGNQTRYSYLQEIIEGHVFAILSAQNKPCRRTAQKICDRISVYFFNRNQAPATPTIVTDAGQIQTLFTQNPPRNNTVISPTLQTCLDTWVAEGKRNDRGAFFLIYTDGLFNDETQFIDCIAKACTQIEHHKMIKIFVLGVGKDLDIEHFLELDFNTYDRMPFDIFVFDLVNELDDITELLKRQLIEHPHTALPNWVKQRYPNFAERFTPLHHQQNCR